MFFEFLYKTKKLTEELKLNNPNRDQEFVVINDSNIDSMSENLCKSTPNNNKSVLYNEDIFLSSNINKLENNLNITKQNEDKLSSTSESEEILEHSEIYNNEDKLSSKSESEENFNTEIYNNKHKYSNIFKLQNKYIFCNLLFIYVIISSLVLGIQFVLINKQLEQLNKKCISTMNKDKYINSLLNNHIHKFNIIINNNDIKFNKLQKEVINNKEHLNKHIIVYEYEFKDFLDELANNKKLLNYYIINYEYLYNNIYSKIYEFENKMKNTTYYKSN